MYYHNTHNNTVCDPQKSFYEPILSELYCSIIDEAIKL